MFYYANNGCGFANEGAKMWHMEINRFNVVLVCFSSFVLTL